MRATSQSARVSAGRIDRGGGKLGRFPRTHTRRRDGDRSRSEFPVVRAFVRIQARAGRGGGGLLSRGVRASRRQPFRTITVTPQPIRASDSARSGRPSIMSRSPVKPERSSRVGRRGSTSWASPTEGSSMLTTDRGFRFATRTTSRWSSSRRPPRKTRLVAPALRGVLSAARALPPAPLPTVRQTRARGISPATSEMPTS